jgi:hypothetical protein
LNLRLLKAVMILQEEDQAAENPAAVNQAAESPAEANQAEANPVTAVQEKGPEERPALVQVTDERNNNQRDRRILLC